MTQPNQDEDAGPHIDVLGLIRRHFRAVMIATIVVTGVVAVMGGVYYRWIQARKHVAFLEFRPTFNGAAQMKYPNDLPFSPNDVTAGAIIDLVFDGNNIGAICNREDFRSGFFVEQRSDQSMFLDLEYQALLSQPRLDSVERRLLQDEYAAKRRALPLQFRLVFVTHPACAGLPPVMVSKVMVDLLATWASESDSKRGVLNHQVEVLTPSVLDVTVGGAGGAVLRADLLRTALMRLIDNVNLVAELPGATLIRLGAQRMTFKEVSGKFSDLVSSKLDPLVMTSGASLVRESAVWVNETVATAERDQQAAEAIAAANQTALREFSGAAQASGAARASAAAVGASASGGQTLVPQIDASFIDRIVAMSAANAKFRQDLTEAMVKAQIAAVASQQRAGYYRRLLQSAQQRSGPQMTTQELDARFSEIVAEGKALTKQFNDLYDEFSRVALRSAASLYQTDKPVAVTISQRFDKWSLLNVVAATFFGMLVLAFAFSVIRERMRLEPR